MKQTVIITGGNTGLGFVTAGRIAREPDWQVIIACRSREKAAAAVRDIIAKTGNRNIAAMALDLASLDKVRGFVREFRARKLPPLRGIICNAGLQFTERNDTKDGFESTFGVNHLGHFLLVNLLLRDLVSPARIVFVSSGTHDPVQFTGMPKPIYKNAKALAWPDKDPDRLKESPAKAGRRAYTNSKLCNILCTYELAGRLQAQGNGTGEKMITVNAFDPGLMPGTGLARNYRAGERLLWNHVLPVLRFFIPNVNTPQKSGQALARLLLDPGLESISGKYFEGFKEIRSSRDSYNTAYADELWQTSIELSALTSKENFFTVTSHSTS